MLSYCLQLVSYPYFITDCLLSSVRLSYFFSLSLGLYLFNIDFGDKDYLNSMASKILI